MALSPTDKQLFEEQRSIRRRNRVRMITLVASLVLILGFLGHQVLAMTVLPRLAMHRLHGQHLETVEDVETTSS
ncbi:hypothetical protein [Pyxidicoccus caerfyrddinensis]|uniref:hypothetical protein n=1 Tax=Pyxidicoccus caerfyrddinensis TaxID=2709663 RepID=UPI0013DD5500|nr:hypothetical protein [Pyxidicoccus caerfyrddinensis]